MKKRRFKGKLIAYYLFSIVLFPFTILFYWMNYLLKVTRLTVVDEKLPRGMNDLKIIHISDLHDACFGKNQCRIIASIKAEQPDLIVVTGDLIDSNRTNITRSMRLIDGIIDLAPVYYVAGNHESRTERYDELLMELQKRKVNIVNDCILTLNKNGEEIEIAGLKDPEFIFGKNKKEYLPYAEKKLKEIITDTEGYTILLCHRPELVTAFEKNNVDLAFCGHAHGGQIRLPFIGGILSPGQGFFPKYTSGVYQKGNTKMIVSRGLGNSAFPWRFNNTPEVISVTLKSK